MSEHDGVRLREALRTILWPRLEGFFHIGAKEGATLDPVLKFGALEAATEQMINEICVIVTDKVGAVRNELGACEERYGDVCDEAARLREQIEKLSVGL